MNMAICQMVTERIVAQLEKGVVPWVRPWSMDGVITGARSHSDGRVYSLLNQMMLGAEGEWLTYKQVEDARDKAIAKDFTAGTVKLKDDGTVDFEQYPHVVKGAKSCPVVFWKMQKIKEKDKATGEETIKNIPILKYYRVFRIGTDVVGIDPKYVTEDFTPTGVDPIAEGEGVVERYFDREDGLELFREDVSGEAFYRPASDEVHVPCLGQYAVANEFYSTLFHEMVHSTGHKNRLNRLTRTAFASESYSKEELVAEMGSAMLMATCGIDTEGTNMNSASYIANWLEALSNDPTLVVAAAGKAEKAVEYILTGKKPTTAGTVEG